MPLQITTDPVAIGRLLEPLVLADPVRNTVLGTVRAYLLNGAGGGGWCARDDVALAVRSSAAHPVALTPGWTDLPALASALDELPDLAGIGGPVAAVEELLGLLSITPASRTDERLYRLDALHEPTGVPGAARPADECELELVAEWLTAFGSEAHGGVPDRFDPRDLVAAAIRERRLWLWTGPTGRPVSMAARQPTAAGVARIGPVYTPPPERAQGYASAVTAQVVRTVLDDAAVPVLYADRANRTSNQIYQAIGFRPVSDRLSVRFA
ncbi:MAG: GNAT family N-acetyltransferase [Jatrophihabitans sp.]|uniref:GNAT family N-acetyltransferase n=1 Tax=Jatrophihabitans sp. TaxID=1932789 RepID=UPI00390EFC3F